MTSKNQYHRKRKAGNEEKDSNSVTLSDNRGASRDDEQSNTSHTFLGN